MWDIIIKILTVLCVVGRISFTGYQQHMRLEEENPEDIRVQHSFMTVLSMGNQVFPVISTGDILTIGFVEQ